MNPISRAADESIGRVFRWLGTQWSSGRVIAERRDLDLHDLVDAMGEVLTQARFMGHGWAVDRVHQPALGAALAKVESSVMRLPENIAADVTAFAEKARPFAEGAIPRYDRDGLQAAFDTAAASIREYIR